MQPQSGGSLSLPGVLTAAVGIQTLASLAVLTLPTLAPLAMVSFGIGQGWIGFQTSLIYLVATLGSFAAGAMVRRLGAARTSQIALLSAALGLVVQATGSFPALFLASTAIGLGYALTNPAASHILNRTPMGGRRYLVFSLKQTSVPLGGVLAGLALPLIATLLGWQAAALLAALVLAAAAAALQPLRPAWDSDRTAAPEAGARSFSGIHIVLADPRLRSMALMGFLCSAVQLALSAFLVLMLHLEFGWSEVAAGMGAAAVQLAGAIGRPIWGMIADRTGNGFRVLAVISLLTAFFAISMAFAHQLPTPLLMLVLVGFGATAIAWNGVMLGETTRRAPDREAGAATAAILIFTFAGVVIGPVGFAGLAALTGSYSSAYAVAAISPLLAALHLLATEWRTRSSG